MDDSEGEFIIDPMDGHIGERIELLWRNLDSEGVIFLCKRSIKALRDRNEATSTIFRGVLTLCEKPERDFSIKVM